MKKQNKKSDMSGVAIPGFLLIGIGYGLLVGQVAAFTLIGLGLGFLVMFLMSHKNK